MWYWIFRAIILVILKLSFKVQVEGLSNLPQKTNFIIVANHASFLDPILIMAVVPRRIYCIVSRFVHKILLFRWFVKMIVTLPAGRSSEKAVNLLMDNKNVGLFPEGGCSRNGKLREFRRGAALLAFKTGRPIVPCGIIGAYEAFPRKAKFPKLFLPIKIKIGKPIFLLKKFENVIEDIDLQEGMFKVKETIKGMIYA